MRRLLILLVLMLTPSVCFAQANAHMLAGVNAQTGTSYTIVAADQIKLLTFNNANPVAVSLPSAVNANFGAGTLFAVRNLGAGTVTISVASGFIDGANTFVLTTGQGADIYSDGANYFTQKGTGANITGMSAAQVAIAASPNSISSSKAIQGASDPNILGSGTVSGVSQPLCTDAAGGATTVACPSGGGGATPPNFQAQVYNNGAFGSTPCFNVSAPASSTALGTHGCDTSFKGPMPYADIRAFGARTCVSNTSPCVAGITGSINSGSTSLTLSSASTFVNGDGIVVYNAGPAALVTSAPTGVTVTNVLAKMGTGTGLNVPSAAGTNTKCYKVIARDKLGGYTPASTETCTTTGQTLGPIIVNLTSCTRNGNGVTCTTSSAHPLTVNAAFGTYGEVVIGGSITDNSFKGSREVTTVTDSTHFSFIDSTISTTSGATTSATGGTATFYAANLVTWNDVTNAWVYYVYCGASNAETYCGASRPQAPGTVLDHTFEDYGTLLAGVIPPPFIPTTPPSVGANENLSTTIASGAGGTAVTLSTSAGATVASVGTRLDACPGITAAFNASHGGQAGPVLIPSDSTTNPFVVNSFCDFSSNNFAIEQSGTLWLHDTLALAGGTRWTGDRSSAQPFGAGGGAGVWAHYPQIVTAEAAPGIYLSNGNSVSFEGLDFQSAVGNGVFEMLIEQGFNVYFKDVRFVTGTGSSDLMGYGLIMRQSQGGGQSVSGIIMDKFSFSTGMTSEAQSHNTAFFCNGCGDTTIKNAYNNQSGLIFLGNSGGANLKLVQDHYNGGFTPLVSIAGKSSVVLGEPAQPIIMDTVADPCVSSFDTAVINVVHNGCTPGGIANPGPAVTGIVSAASWGSTFTTQPEYNNALTTQTFPVTSFGGVQSLVWNVAGPGGISTNYDNAPIFVIAPPPAAPTCSVSAGGSVPIGNWRFISQAFWYNGREGLPSLSSPVCTTTTGNQTITVNWTVSTGNPQFMGVFASGNGGASYSTCGACSATFSPSTTSLIWSTSTIGSPNAQTTAALGGATELLPGVGGIIAPTYSISSPAGVTDVITAPSLTTQHSVILPDNAGFIPVTGYQNTAFDGFNRSTLNTSGPCIGGSCWSTVTSPSIFLNISGNQITDTNCTLAWCGIFWNANSFSPDQMSALTEVAFAVGGNVVVPMVRYNSSLNEGYVCGGSILLVNFGLGTSTSLATGLGTVSGDTIWLDIKGNVLTCYDLTTGVSITATDSTLATGSPGIASVGNSANIADNWMGGNFGPLTQGDREFTFRQPLHAQTIAVGALPIAGALGVGIYSGNWAPSSGVCTDSTSRLTTTACAGGSITGMTAGQVAIAGSASTITSSKPLQGTDTNILTSSTVAAGTGNSLCTDTGSGATTTGCPTLSGMTSGQVPIAGSATTVTSSKALQGTDTNVLSSGTVSGTGATLCTDANGGATTTGCTGGSISGLTAGQVAIAGTTTTITSSKAIAGTDANILSAGTVSSSANSLLCTDANGGATTSNCSVYNTQSAATNANIAATNMVASAPANTMYLYMWTISLTTAGTGCTSTTSVVLNAIFTDPSAAGSITESLGQISIAPGGNGTLGFVAQGTDTIYAKSGTAVQYSTSGYTPGTGCTVNPSYQVTMRLQPMS